MEEKYKVLILAENLEMAMFMCRKEICSNVDFDILCGYTEEERLVKYIKLSKPNVIFYNLSKLSYNRKETLKILNQLDIKIILIISDASIMNTINLLSFENIYRIYIEPLNWNEIKKDLDSIFLYRKENKSADLISKSNNEKLKNLIIHEISIFNFNKSSKGYKYLIMSIIETIQDDKKLENIEKNLFPIIATKFNIDNSKKIKWNIQKVIDSMLRYTDDIVIKKYFPYAVKPTTKMFLSEINISIKNKYSE